MPRLKASGFLLFRRSTPARSVRDVPEFAAEQYVSRTETLATKRAAGRARAAAEELSREGNAIEFVRSIFVPEDETCLYLYRADSRDVVLEGARRAGLRFERVVEAITHAGGAGVAMRAQE